MKKIISILILLSCYSSVRAQYVIEKSPIVITVENKVINSCQRGDSLCYVLSVARHHKGQTLILLFPQSGTTTGINLYNYADYYTYKDNPTYLDYKIKRRDAKKLLDGQPLTLNLTGLPDGHYILHYGTCDLGGLIKIRLVTKST